MVGVGADVGLAVQREALGAPGHRDERPGTERLELPDRQIPDLERVALREIDALVVDAHPVQVER
jgi:hypothetical protein